MQQYGQLIVNLLQKAQNFTKKGNRHSEDPYVALKKGISNFSTKGEIFLIGDFNARKIDNPYIQLGNDMGEDNNPLWLRENEEHPWRRTSPDG